MSDELESFFESLPERAAGKGIGNIQASYVFEVEGEDAWTVRIARGKVDAEKGSVEDANCTITATRETFLRLLRGELSAFSAYVGGSLKIRGDVGAALQLQRIL